MSNAYLVPTQLDELLAELTAVSGDCSDVRRIATAVGASLALEAKLTRQQGDLTMARFKAQANLMARAQGLPQSAPAA